MKTHLRKIRLPVIQNSILRKIRRPRPDFRMQSMEIRKDIRQTHREIIYIIQTVAVIFVNKQKTRVHKGPNKYIQVSTIDFRPKTTPQYLGFTGFMSKSISLCSLSIFFAYFWYFNSRSSSRRLFSILVISSHLRAYSFSSSILSFSLRILSK